MIEKINVSEEAPLMDGYNIAVKLNEIIDKVNELDDRTKNLSVYSGASMSGFRDSWSGRVRNSFKGVVDW